MLTPAPTSMAAHHRQASGHGMRKKVQVSCKLVIKNIYYFVKSTTSFSNIRCILFFSLLQID